MDSKEIFSRNLNHYMRERGKSRTDVADALGVSYFTFTDWVKGKKFPRMDKVEKLAKYFDIRISDLVEKESIDRNPIGIANFHAQILKDKELMGMIEEYYELSDTNQEMIRNLIHNLKKEV